MEQVLLPLDRPQTQASQEPGGSLCGAREHPGVSQGECRTGRQAAGSTGSGRWRWRRVRGRQQPACTRRRAGWVHGRRIRRGGLLQERFVLRRNWQRRVPRWAGRRQPGIAGWRFTGPMTAQQAAAGCDSATGAAAAPRCEPGAAGASASDNARCRGGGAAARRGSPPAASAPGRSQTPAIVAAIGSNCSVCSNERFVCSVCSNCEPETGARDVRQKMMQAS